MECVENEERVGDAEQGDESDDACVAVQATDFLAHDFTDEFVADNLLLVEFFTQQLKLLLHLVKFNVRFVGHGRRVKVVQRCLTAVPEFHATGSQLKGTMPFRVSVFHLFELQSDAGESHADVFWRESDDVGDFLVGEAFQPKQDDGSVQRLQALDSLAKHLDLS